MKQKKHAGFIRGGPTCSEGVSAKANVLLSQLIGIERYQKMSDYNVAEILISLSAFV